MSYKSLLDKIVKLISSPREAWNDIDSEIQDKKVVSDFVYPLIGLCALSEFIGVFLGKDMSAELFQMALTRSCAIAVSLFGGFFLAAYLLEKIGRKYFGSYLGIDSIQILVGYSMVVLFVLDIIGGLFLIDVLHWILQVYTFFIVFEGARSFIKISEKQLTTYTIVASLIILLSPALIKTVFNLLSVTLN